MKNQGYRFKDNSAVKICRWCKKSLVDEGGCYKQKFYGIKSHLCCQMSPNLSCQNKCLHCWRAIELNFNVKKNSEPKEIIKNCIEQQRKLLSGFKGNKKINLEKLKQAQEPMHFAISLIGEPTLYLKLGEFIKELKNQGKTSFLVTNGLVPEALEKLEKQNALPTQLYISLNYSNEEMFRKITKNQDKGAWKKFNQSLEVMKALKNKTRRVLRMTLVKDLNMNDEMIKEYAELIKKANSDFVEVKGFVSVGFARQRLGYDKMPTYKEIQKFAEKLAKLLNLKILDKHEFSRVVLIGKDEKKIGIKINL